MGCQWRWKLIHHRRNDRRELYHLKNDPLEQQDLAADEPERVAALLALLDKMAEGDQ